MSVLITSCGPQHRTERNRLRWQRRPTVGARREKIKRRTRPSCLALVSLLLVVSSLYCVNGFSQSTKSARLGTWTTRKFVGSSSASRFSSHVDLKVSSSTGELVAVSNHSSIGSSNDNADAMFAKSSHSDATTHDEPPTPQDKEAMSKWKKDDLETYQVNLQIAALAECCASHRNVTAAKMALQLLRSMERPDSVAFNSVLKALAKVSPAVLTGTTTASDAAEILLREMQSLHKKQVAANEAWYEQLSNGILTEEQMDQGAPRVRVKPNVRSVSTVMDALGRTGKLEAARRAQELLNELQQEYEKTQDGALQPNLISYNTLLSAYANCGEARKCLEIIRSMPVAPDIISHNAVLHALARCRDNSPQKAGARAETYLRSITNVQPNARSYSTCMDAWSQSGQPERAYRLLQEMMRAYRSSGRSPALRPNAITYSTVIHGYAVSKDPEKAVRAFQVWQDMQKAGVKPNQVTLNNVLNACATTRPPTPIVRRMVQTLYKHSLSHGHPDEVTFGIVLKACQNWMDDAAISPIDVFGEACKRGVVSQGVLHHLRQAVPSEVFRQLVGDHYNWNDLPLQWRARVRPASRKRR